MPDARARVRHVPAVRRKEARDVPLFERLGHALAGGGERQVEIEDLLDRIPRLRFRARRGVVSGLWLVAQRDGPRHRIAELADVPRPRVALPAREQGSRDGAGAAER